MAGYRGHMIGALLAWLSGVLAMSFWAPLNLWRVAEWGLMALFGGFFPDLDTKSMGQKWFFRIISIVAVIFIFYKLFKLVAFLLLISCVPLLSNHRGLMHSLWFILAVIFLSVFLLTRQFPSFSVLIVTNAFFFLLGAISHLWLDKHPFVMRPGRRSRRSKRF